MDSPATRSFLDTLINHNDHHNFDTALDAWRPFEAPLRGKTTNVRRSALPANYFDGLIDIFNVPEDLRTMSLWKDQGDLQMRLFNVASDMQVVYRRKRRNVPQPHMDLPSFDRVVEVGRPAFATCLPRFQENWDLFSRRMCNVLANLSNVVVAGGAVEACLAPDRVTGDDICRRDFFMGSIYGGSDIDLFTYGLDTEEIMERAIQIRASIAAETERLVAVKETEHTITFDPGFSHCKVQLIKQEYGSPAEILANFDLDAPCALYTGSAVWVSPRSFVAMRTLTNTVDFTRANCRSYEYRLAKYGVRGYRVHDPACLDGEEPISMDMAISLEVRGSRLLLAFSRSMENAMKTTQNRDEVMGVVSDYARRMAIDDYADDCEDTFDSDNEQLDI